MTVNIRNQKKEIKENALQGKLHEESGNYLGHEAWINIERVEMTNSESIKQHE